MSYYAATLNYVAKEYVTAWNDHDTLYSVTPFLTVFEKHIYIRHEFAPSTQMQELPLIFIFLNWMKSGLESHPTWLKGRTMSGTVGSYPFPCTHIHTFPWTFLLSQG